MTTDYIHKDGCNPKLCDNSGVLQEVKKTCEGCIYRKSDQDLWLCRQEVREGTACAQREEKKPDRIIAVCGCGVRVHCGEGDNVTCYSCGRKVSTVPPPKPSEKPVDVYGRTFDPSFQSLTAAQAGSTAIWDQVKSNVLDDIIMKSIGQSFKKKENKMKVLPKILRRAIVVWCLYGVGKLCVLVNPFVVQLAKYVDGEKYTTGSVACTWVAMIGTCAILVGLSYAVHKFSTWLFNEDKKG